MGNNNIPRYGLRLKLSQFDTVNSIQSGDLLLGSQGDNEVQFTVDQLLAYLSNGDGKMIITLGPPDPSKGANDEYALDPTTGTIYGPKVNNLWPIGTPLVAMSLSLNYSTIGALDGSEIFHITKGGQTYLTTALEIMNYVQGNMTSTVANNVNGGNF